MLEDFDYAKTYKKFKSLKKDIDRWKFLQSLPKGVITVYLDNDYTYAAFNTDGDCDDWGEDDPRWEIEEYTMRFNDFLGNSGGVCDLLDLLNINYEYV